MRSSLPARNPSIVMFRKHFPELENCKVEFAILADTRLC